MKIAIEAQRLFRRKKHGMEIVALEVIRRLQEIDHANEYLLFIKEGEDPGAVSSTANFSIDHAGAGPYPVWEQVHLPKALKRWKPDLLHCTANTAPLSGTTPLIVTIHDVIYLESINFSGSAYQNFGNLYRRSIVPRVAKKATLIITVSEFEKKVIAGRLGISKEKIRVVYNGVNDQFKKINDKNLLEDFRNKYKLPARFLLHFANTAPKKNTTGVLIAYGEYVSVTSQPLPLVLTDCTSEMIAGILQKINQPGLMTQIHILDYVPFAKIPLLYNLATVFLYPSHRESFGMPVIEAMACGVPVITSNTSALPEIAGDAACLADPSQPSTITGFIIRLLSEPEYYLQKQESGYKNARRFSWKNAATETLALYREIGNLK